VTEQALLKPYYLPAPLLAAYFVVKLVPMADVHLNGKAQLELSNFGLIA